MGSAFGRRNSSIVSPPHPRAARSRCCSRTRTRYPSGSHLASAAYASVRRPELRPRCPRTAAARQHGFSFLFAPARCSIESHAERLHGRNVSVPVGNERQLADTVERVVSHAAELFICVVLERTDVVI